jgi:dTDP-4-amino-4,6-dideoxygalactose transaminase
MAIKPKRIRVNKPIISKAAARYVQQSLQGVLNGGDHFTKQCQQLLKKQTGVAQVLLTSSCTDALEMATLLANLQPGDEVIMPSYTFSSSANAVALRGAVPVFVDIRPDTLNIDEKQIAGAITKRTRAIMPVHYAGVGCAMDAIMTLARKHKLLVIEDAAQGVGCTYHGRALGSIGDFGAYSFHASKIITSGEGGALLVRDHKHTLRAETLWEKGTNRAQLLRGEIKKYLWVDIGSSFLIGEMPAALLLSQLQEQKKLIATRLKIWANYRRALLPLHRLGHLQLTAIPSACQHNGHIFYILCRNGAERDALKQYLAKNDIEAVSHYEPLHSAPAGKKFGRVTGKLPTTDRAAATILRLPIHPALTAAQQKHIIVSIKKFYGQSH